MRTTDKLARKKLQVALLAGAELLIDNGLGDWKINMNGMRKSVAETCHSQKTITYSKYFLLVADKDQFIGVTLHEVTHALMGRGSGHGDKFIELCTKISPTPLYARPSMQIPIHRYLLRCPECGYSGSHSQKIDRYCLFCFEKGKTVKFAITPNVLTVKAW